MDGGGLLVRDGQVTSAWRRGKDVYLAETAKPEVDLGQGQDVALAANHAGLYVVWSTPDGIVVRLPGSGISKLSQAASRPSPPPGTGISWSRG